MVRAQDVSTQERLDRLERDMTMLQRQVYRGTGGEAPPGAESGGGTAVDVQVRMDRLEQQMRDLTGRVEDESNQVQQLRQRVEQINSDIDVRLNQGRKGQGQGQSQGQDAASAPPPRGRAGALAPPEPPLAEPAALTPYGRPPPPPPPPGYGTLTPPGPDTRMGTPYPGPAALTPPQVASAGGGLRPSGPDGLRSGSASAQYNSAFGLLRKANYPAAEEALRSFIQQHPNDPLAGNAQYWLGESFYARGKYAEAAAAFADGYKRYPRGSKAAGRPLKARHVALPRQSKAQCLHRADAARPRFPASGKRRQGPGGAGEEEARVLSPVASAPPLGLDEFAARLDRLAFFETAPLVAVAVSGGPDSLALAILADRWARRRGGEIRALCVDHRLRPESGAEISRVAGWLAARSIGCEILVWEGKKPGTRIQETARTARYRLLGEWCRAYGCLHLLTGHHREDQVETYLLRRDAHSGPDGLAGMPAIREIGGCRILRPLLDIPKARLLATLAAEAQPFLTDPSNRDPAYARARLRERAAGADPGAIVDDIRRLGRERVLREQARDALLARAAAVHPAGFAVLDPAVLLSAPADLAERALSALVFGLGGADYPPRRRAVARLLRVLAGEARGGHVLGGYRFVGWRGRILVLREIAAAAGPARAGPGRGGSVGSAFRGRPARRPRRP